MKTLIALMMATISVTAGGFGEFTLAPFAAVKYTEYNETSGKAAGGIGIGYRSSDRVAFEASVLSYKLEDSTVLNSIDEVAGNLKFYLRKGKLSPYALVGYTRDTADDRNLANLGGGVELSGKRFVAGVGITLRHQLERRGLEALAQASVGIRF